jgi:hypothetical protein
VEDELDEFGLVSGRDEVSEGVRLDFSEFRYRVVGERESRY